ncbi:MAG: hypothetical protein HYW24_04920 [Candidatus Aenigmarchaeota archaeon]|nr:hypothetical protein [Candidatus Aenigmarchaeota archaeon]
MRNLRSDTIEAAKAYTNKSEYTEQQEELERFLGAVDSYLKTHENITEENVDNFQANINAQHKIRDIYPYYAENVAVWMRYSPSELRTYKQLQKRGHADIPVKVQRGHGPRIGISDDQNSSWSKAVKASED